MLQRIQSVFLFLVFVFTFLFVVLPLANFPLVSPDMPLRISKFRDFYALLDLSGAWMGYLLLVLFIFSALLTIYITFLYKKRLLQIQLGRLNMFLHIVMIVVAFFMIDSVQKQVNDAEFSYGPGVIFPLLSLLFIFFANRAIRKDEELVRSADRFR